MASKYSKNVDYILQRKLKSQPKLIPVFPSMDYEPFEYVYLIALVAMSIPGNWLKPVEINGHQTMCIATTRASTVADGIFAAAEQAWQRGASLVCFPEYCYPTGTSDLQDRLAGLSGKGCIIVAGSYIQATEGQPRYASCPVFMPRCNEPFLQHKHVEGKSKEYIGGKWEEYEEDIDIPRHQETKVFFTKYGRIAVALCIDVQDENLTHNVRVLSLTEEDFRQPLDILIVPSRCGGTGAEAIRMECEHVSRETRSCVLYVNDSKLDAPKMYLCGVLQAEVQEEVKEEVKAIPDGSGQVHMYSLNLAELRNTRRRQVDEGITVDVLKDQNGGKP